MVVVVKLSTPASPALAERATSPPSNNCNDQQQQCIRSSSSTAAMPSRAARFKASVVRVVCLALVFLAVGRVGALGIAAGCGRFSGRCSPPAHSRGHPSDLAAGGGRSGAGGCPAHHRRRAGRPRRLDVRAASRCVSEARSRLTTAGRCVEAGLHYGRGPKRGVAR